MSQPSEAQTTAVKTGETTPERAEEMIVRYKAAYRAAFRVKRGSEPKVEFTAYGTFRINKGRSASPDLFEQVIARLVSLCATPPSR